MRKVFILSIVLSVALTNKCLAQSGFTTFNTLTFFYIDNSEGYNSNPENSSLSPEVSAEFMKRMNGVADKPDNYFFLMGCNGENPKQSNNAKSLLASEWVKKYLANTSREADYPTERRLLRESFSTYNIRIKKQVDVFLFLSGYAINQLSKKMEELPTPVFFPKEVGIYLNNNDIVYNIIVYTNKDVVDKLSLNKIKDYFMFCNTSLKLDNYNLEIQQF